MLRSSAVSSPRWVSALVLPMILALSAMPSARRQCVTGCCTATAASLAFLLGPAVPLRRQGSTRRSPLGRIRAIMFTALTAVSSDPPPETTRYLSGPASAWRGRTAGLRPSCHVDRAGTHARPVRNASIVHDCSAPSSPVGSFFASCSSATTANPIATGEPVGGDVLFQHVLLGYAARRCWSPSSPA